MRDKVAEYLSKIRQDQADAYVQWQALSGAVQAVEYVLSLYDEPAPSEVSGELDDAGV
jgi:hypothetical protein